MLDSRRLGGMLDFRRLGGMLDLDRPYDLLSLVLPMRVYEEHLLEFAVHVLFEVHLGPFGDMFLHLVLPIKHIRGICFDFAPIF